MRRLRPHPLPVALALVFAVGASLIAAPRAQGLLGAMLAATMIATAMSDARRFIIPDALVVAALALAFADNGLVAFDAGLLRLAGSIAGAAAAALAFWLIMIGYRLARGRDGLGLGDVKLAAVAGAWLEPFTILGIVEGAALAGIAAYLIAGRRRGTFSAAHMIPFGVFLAPAIWIGWLMEKLLPLFW